MGIFAEHHQAGINHGLTLHGDVVEHVLGLFKTGGCIDIAAEFGADALQPVENSLSGEMLGAVEAHVLEEMCKTVLVGSFLDGTNIGCKIKLGTMYGELVVTDVVGKPVVEFSYLYCGIPRKGPHHGIVLCGHRHGRRCGKNCDKQLLHFI